jgi:hypothetical protein
MAAIVLVVTDGVFPKTTLPECLFLPPVPGEAFLYSPPGSIPAPGHIRLNQPPSSGKIRISLRQLPNAVQVFWQQDPGSDDKGQFAPDAVNSETQNVSCPMAAQPGSSFVGYLGEEVVSARLQISSILGHVTQAAVNTLCLFLVMRYAENANASYFLISTLDYSYLSATRGSTRAARRAGR